MVTLIVVLAGIGLSTYSTSVTRAKEAVLREDLFRMRDAIDQYNADKGTYPPDLASLVTDKYMRQIPKDPITDSADTWQIVMSEPDPANPNAAPGVYDVKSGAPGRRSTEPPTPSGSASGNRDARACLKTYDPLRFSPSLVPCRCRARTCATSSSPTSSARSHLQSSTHSSQSPIPRDSHSP